METGSFVRFATTGVVATLVDLMVTMMLIPWVPHYLWANTGGFVVANLVQFAIVHRWVFRNATRLTWQEAYMASLGISALGLTLSNILVLLMVDFAGWHIVLAKLVTALVTVVFNFGLRRILIYSARA